MFIERQKREGEAKERQRQAQLKEFCDQLAPLVSAAITNLKQHDYPTNPPHAALWEVDGEQKVGWIVATYMSYTSSDTLFLLSDGRLMHSRRGVISLEEACGGAFFSRGSFQDLSQGFESLRDFTPASETLQSAKAPEPQTKMKRFWDWLRDLSQPTTPRHQRGVLKYLLYLATLWTIIFM